KPDGDAESIVAGDFAKDETPYNVVWEGFIPRVATDLAHSTTLLLGSCDERQFDDPYLDPSEPRFRNTFKAMLHLCNRDYIKRIEIHREKPDPFIPGVQQAKYERQLSALVPAGVIWMVVFWSQSLGGLD